jgi:hypothetical protein
VKGTVEDTSIFDTEGEVWEEDAVYPVMIAFDLQSDHFSDETDENLRISVNEIYFMRFDGNK